MSRFGVAWGVARDQVRMARALQEMPETRRAVEAGDVSMSGVRVLVAAHDADPETFAHDEPHLVEAARIHPIGDLRRVAAFWRQQVEAEQLATGGDEAIRARRRLHASVSFLGMVRLNGDLDPRAARRSSRR